MSEDEYLFRTTSRPFANRLMRDRHWIAGEQHYVVTTTVLDPTPSRGELHWTVRGRPERDDDTCPVAE
jgi:hypothetical protein